MLRRKSTLWLAILPLAVLLTSLAVLSDAWATVPSQGAAYPVPECVTGTLKSADPAKLYVGDQTMVTAVITGTCPAYDLPIDLVLVVDKSNSMTKGLPGGNNGTPGIDPNPTQGNISPFPTNPIPNPKPTTDPGPIPTAIAPEGEEEGAETLEGALPGRVRGLGQQPAPNTPGPTDPPSKPTQGGNISPATPTSLSGNVVRRGEVEPAGTEDNIRAMQQIVAEFLSNIENDVKAGKVRVSLVQFDERARSLVPLTDNVAKVRSALLRIRGGGNTRIDLGIQGGQRELVGANVRGRTDLDHRKMMIVFSDGIVDARTVIRLRTRDNVDVMSVAIGRNANRANLRKVASKAEYAFNYSEMKGLVETFNKVAPSKRQVTIPVMDITEQLAPNMELVAGSVNPPASAMPDARTLTWHLAPPTLPFTMTYAVRPMEVGLHKLSVANGATFSDSEKRTFQITLPEVTLEVLKPGGPDANQ